MQAAVKALTNVHGTSYKYGPAAITICKYEVFIIWRGEKENVNDRGAIVF